MALSASSVWEVRTTGSDTNGGGFVAGAAGADWSQQDAKNTTNQGTTTLSAAITTTGATTCSVTAASALYGAAQALLAAPLVGDWIEIDSEIMKVTGVSTNTLTITRAQLGTSAATHSNGATVTNISNVSTTDWATAGSTTITSATAFFSANLVGNIVYVQGGTGSVVAGWYQVTAAGTSGSSTTITVDRSTGLTAGTGATGNIGGALASPGQSVALLVGGNLVWIKSGTYSITSASTNISGGCMSVGVGPVKIEGYSSTRGDYGTKPLLQASGISTFTIITNSTNGLSVNNVVIDGASLTSSRAITNAARAFYYKVTCKNCTNSAFAPGSSMICIQCIATGCSTVTAFNGANVLICLACEGYDNTVTAFTASTAGSVFLDCIAYSNTGGSTIGFSLNIGNAFAVNCVAYANGSHGFSFGNANVMTAVNCVAEGNTGVGFDSTNNNNSTIIINCAAYNNTGGNIVLSGTGSIFQNIGFITYTASAFVNAAGGNFALNNTVGGGASLRAAGIPGTFPDGLTIGYLDIGAAQHQDSPAFVFFRKQFDASDGIVNIDARRTLVVSHPPTPVFYRRQAGPVELESLSATRPTFIVSHMPNPVLVRRPVVYEDSESMIATKRTSVFIPATIILPTPVFYRRQSPAGEPEAQPPVKRTSVFVPAPSSSSQPVINSIRNQYFFDNEES